MARRSGSDFGQHVCGCYYTMPSSAFFKAATKTYLPLIDLAAHTTILSNTSRTFLTQIYHNSSSTGLLKEVIYTFPLYDGVSVTAFTCRIGSRIIKGVVKERNKAKAVYNEAAARGEAAGLLEQLPEASDVFSTRLSNIPAGEKVIVEITYLGELRNDAGHDGVRFTLPTMIAPRYGSTTTQGTGGLKVLAPKSSGGISISVDAVMAEGSFIKSVQSPSHPIAVILGSTSLASQEAPQMHNASASLSLGSTELDKDFVLIVLADITASPKAIMETHPTLPDQRALMVTLVPKFVLPPSRPEIVFIADRSGSMTRKIPTLISALKVFLKSLPVGVKFNICSFGSSYSFLWPRSRSYDQSSLVEAIQHVETFQANYGGTEMFPSVKATLQQRYKDLALEVMLLTDGETWAQEHMFLYLNKEVGNTEVPIRVFTLGIGNSVSHALVEGIARAGNGFAQIVGEGEKLDSKVVRMLKGGLFPHITDYTLEVKYEGSENSDDQYELIERVTDGLRVLSVNPTNEARQPAPSTISLFDTTANPDKEEVPPSDPNGHARYAHLPAIQSPKILQAPHKIPPLFPFIRTTVYLIFSPRASQKIPKTVILKATSTHGLLKLEIPVSVLSDPGETIHQLAAKKAVVELEEGRGWLAYAKDEGGVPIKERLEGRWDEIVEREAVRLGVNFQVGGKHSSFVAVEANSEELAEKVKKAKEEEKMKQKRESAKILVDDKDRLLSTLTTSTAVSDDGWTDAAIEDDMIDYSDEESVISSAISTGTFLSTSTAESMAGSIRSQPNLAFQSDQQYSSASRAATQQTGVQCSRKGTGGSRGGVLQFSGGQRKSPFQAKQEVNLQSEPRSQLSQPPYVQQKIEKAQTRFGNTGQEGFTCGQTNATQPLSTDTYAVRCNADSGLIQDSFDADAHDEADEELQGDVYMDERFESLSENGTVNASDTQSRNLKTRSEAVGGTPPNPFATTAQRSQTFGPFSSSNTVFQPQQASGGLFGSMSAQHTPQPSVIDHGPGNLFGGVIPQDQQEVSEESALQQIGVPQWQHRQQGSGGSFGNKSALQQENAGRFGQPSVEQTRQPEQKVGLFDHAPFTQHQQQQQQSGCEQFAFHCSIPAQDNFEAPEYDPTLADHEPPSGPESAPRSPPKAQEPPQPEKRHHHAMRRPRGPGGRFLTPDQIADMEETKQSPIAEESYQPAATKSFRQQRLPLSAGDSTLSSKKRKSVYILPKHSVPGGASSNSPFSPAPTPTTHADRLHLIIALQNFDGSWELDQALCKCIGTTAEVAEAEMPAASSTQHIAQANRKRVWATILAIIFLEKNLAKEKDTWELVVGKARSWSDGVIGGGLEGWFMDAEGFLLD
ncbi:MAG: hypothetical protein M1827_006945 [Pycnora praestabilis]|nr:MAG: hypothetical protein M1827_006945 [Pycnora praestabilis]